MPARSIKGLLLMAAIPKVDLPGKCMQTDRRPLALKTLLVLNSFDFMHYKTCSFSGKKAKRRRRRPPSSSVATDEEGMPHLKSYRKLKSPKTSSNASTRVQFPIHTFIC